MLLDEAPFLIAPEDVSAFDLRPGLVEIVAFVSEPELVGTWGGKGPFRLRQSDHAPNTVPPAARQAARRKGCAIAELVLATPSLLGACEGECRLEREPLDEAGGATQR